MPVDCTCFLGVFAIIGFACALGRRGLDIGRFLGRFIFVLIAYLFVLLILEAVVLVETAPQRPEPEFMLAFALRTSLALSAPLLG